MYCRCVREGDTREKLLEVADMVKADAIVMGSHERVGIGGLLLGSVARKIPAANTRPGRGRAPGGGFSARCVHVAFIYGSLA